MFPPVAARRRAVHPRQLPSGGLGSLPQPTPSDTADADSSSTSSPASTPSSTPTSTSTSTPESTTSTQTPTSTPTSTTPTATPTSTSESSSTRSSTNASTSTKTSFSTNPSWSATSSSATNRSSSPTSTTTFQSTDTSSVPSSTNLTSATPFTTLSANASLSGDSFTTFTSSIVTEINGTPTTAAIAIVTALNSDSSGDGLDSHERTAVIAGAAVGGTALLVILFAGFFYYRRRVDKKRYTFLKREPPSRAAFLADELDAPPHGGYRDVPFAVPGRAAVASGAGAGAYELPSRSLRAQTSESGSIFREDVWPPPKTPLMEPSTGPPSLHGVVEDEIAPSASSPIPFQNSPGIGLRPSALEPRLRGGSGDASLWSQESAPRPASETSQTALIPEYDSLPRGHAQDTSSTPLLSDTASAIEYDTRLGPLAPTNPDRYSADLASPPPSGLPGH
ncbi:hypothetical protein PENSPDRAFT_754331 [Peniophora sp. CONT]|nr:hypothetical protein PENSPDRAFT_754331 [Peniophora sp. CONT]